MSAGTVDTCIITASKEGSESVLDENGGVKQAKDEVSAGTVDTCARASELMDTDMSPLCRTPKRKLVKSPSTLEGLETKLERIAMDQWASPTLREFVSGSATPTRGRAHTVGINAGDTLDTCSSSFLRKRILGRRRLNSTPCKEPCVNRGGGEKIGLGSVGNGGIPTIPLQDRPRPMNAGIGSSRKKKNNNPKKKAARDDKNQPKIDVLIEGMKHETERKGDSFGSDVKTTLSQDCGRQMTEKRN